jgi:hypothetical protein
MEVGITKREKKGIKVNAPNSLLGALNSFYCSGRLRIRGLRRKLFLKSQTQVRIVHAHL